MCCLFFVFSLFYFASKKHSYNRVSRTATRTLQKNNNILYISTNYFQSLSLEDCVSLQDIQFLLLMLLFLQASIAHYFSKSKAIKPMNKGNKTAPKKTVSVAASAPLLPHGEQYTPCEAKRRHMAGMTPYHSSIVAGSDSDDAYAEE
jgi:hypothetical protein